MYVPVITGKIALLARLHRERFAKNYWRAVEVRGHWQGGSRRVLIQGGLSAGSRALPRFPVSLGFHLSLNCGVGYSEDFS
jgi:hypothetical protein